MRDFWPSEIRRVKQEYPAFELRDRPPRPDLDPDDAERCGVVVRTWRGMMQPFPPTLDKDELLTIISDLYDGGPALRIDLNGTLRHDVHCRRRAHPLLPDLVPQNPLTATYEMEVAYAVPPMRPIVRAIHPRITVREYPQMPQPIAPLKALCVANAPTDPWNFHSDGALRYLDWTAYFVGKHTLWLECLHRNGRAEWPGRSRPGDPDDEIKNTPPNAPCTCNSEVPYRDCHLAFDLENSERKKKGLRPETRPLSMAFYKSRP
ncbi:MAG TPA: hypothetical protein VGV13_08255 [Methylomirabilota bacterium]|jgi:hypothetical protein|nr:hypothetical protein [Methylomirabilota bacterium]